MKALIASFLSLFTIAEMVAADIVANASSFSSLRRRQR
jgi:hypothetical protein